MNMKIKIPSSTSEIKLHEAQKFWMIHANEKISDTVKWIKTVELFSNVSAEELIGHEIADIQETYIKISKLITVEPENEPENAPLIRFFNHGGTEYGFEPDIRKMETAAFVDLDSYVKDIPRNLNKIMAILYRPVSKKQKQLYLIRSYFGETDWSREHRQQIFLKYMTYDVIRGAVGFFFGAVKKHSNTFKNSDHSQENPIKTSSNGDGSTLSGHSQAETLPNPKKSSKKKSTKT